MASGDQPCNVVPHGTRVSRRGFLELLGIAGLAGVATTALGVPGARAGVGLGRPSALPPGYTPSFPDGVMAGDPAPSGAVIWTRVSEPAVADPVPLLWEVAEDAGFGAIVAGGVVDATSASGRTAKVALDGLGSDRWYHYRFSALGVSSDTGRLRTSPTPDAEPAGLTMVWASCQQRSSLFVAHRAIAAEPDVDLWMHLGDYVYVSDTQTVSLDQYRQAYRHWRTDEALREVQARLATVAVWDDGEFYNGVDATGDPDRLDNARRAWIESFPILPPPGDPHRIHRPVVWGDLAELFMLDTRQHRDPAIDATDTRTPEGAQIFDPDRTTLGTAQRDWLLDGLTGSSRRWKVLGNSYNLAMWRLEDLDDGTRPLPPGVHPNEGVYAPNEAWDDYWAERRALLDAVAAQGVENLVSLSGHTHIWIAAALSPDPDDAASPVAGYDFTCGSLTADPDLIGQAVGNGATPEAAHAFYRNLAEASRVINPWQAYVNFTNFGYGVARFGRDELVVEYKALDVFDPDARPVVLARFVLPAGNPCAMRAEYLDEPLFGHDVAPASVPHGPWNAPCVPPTGSGPPEPPDPPASAPAGAAPASPATATPRITG